MPKTYTSSAYDSYLQLAKKNYSATYLGLVPIFEERSGCVFSPSISDVDLSRWAGRQMDR